MKLQHLKQQKQRKLARVPKMEPQQQEKKEGLA